MNNSNDSTIAAISSAMGEAGIGVIRVSGPDSLSVAEKIFKGPRLTPRYMHYGHIVNPDTGKILDQVLCVYMKAPHTYTGEDVVEIQCHGSIVSLKNILSLCLSNGAEAAERGEFTKRAFLNGKMDLSQAEAVIDLIKAKTELSFDSALGQMQGRLSEKVKSIRKLLLDLLVNLGVNMDYPDEDIEEITYSEIEKSLSQINDEILKLSSSFNDGKIIREGISLAIVGKPNVGKSSLMNVFLNEDRSIVTSVPGTTRDTIEETASLRGIPVRLTDTAGIHDSSDEVEAIGIERSKKVFSGADLLLLVIDSSSPIDDEDLNLLENAHGKPCIVVLNKQDLKHVVFPSDIDKIYPGVRTVCTAFNTGQGSEELKDAIFNIIGSGINKNENALVTNARHYELLRKASDEISEALIMTKSKEAIDFIEINVKASFDYLGEITGDTASGEIIDEIFSRFCLGK